MDKDNPDSFIPSSSTGHVFSSDSPVVRHVLEAPGAAASGSAPPTSGSPPESVKRRPGRPKGSSKKDLLGSPPPLPKIKRPVGRPRKDGLPAGSVGPKRAKVKRNPHTWVAHQGVEYPPVNVFVPGGSLSSHMMTFHTDPNMEMDDWAELARDKPDILLVILLTALTAPNAAPNVGPTVEEAFRSHLASLAINSQQLQSIPSLYSVLKTFWLPSSPAYFSLTASTSTVANAVLRSVKEREDIHSAKTPAKIAASWNVEGVIAGGQTRGVRKVGLRSAVYHARFSLFHFKLASYI